MASKLVVQRERSAQHVRSVEVHLGELQASVEEALGPHLREGEAVPDVALLARLLLRRLDADTAAMVAADDAHARELEDDSASREARDGALEAARAEVFELRELVGFLWGGEALAAAGLREMPPRDPVELVRYLQKASAQVEELNPGEGRLGVQVDLAARAGQLRAHQSNLSRALEDVKREQREGERTQGAKSLAILRYDESFAAAAGLTHQLLLLAGRPDLAERVRPSTRRRGRRAQEDEEPAEG